MADVEVAFSTCYPLDPPLLVKFALVNSFQTFEQGSQICESLELDAQPASFVRESQYLFANTFINSIPTPDVSQVEGARDTVFIGLFDETPPVGETTVTSRFTWVDQTPYDDFGIVALQFPWNSAEPNNFQGEGCVELQLPQVAEGEQEEGVELVHEWNDVRCENLARILCMFPCELDETVAPTVTIQEVIDEAPSTAIIGAAAAAGVCFLVASVGLVRTHRGFNSRARDKDLDLITLELTPVNQKNRNPDRLSGVGLSASSFRDTFSWFRGSSATTGSSVAVLSPVARKPFVKKNINKTIEKEIGF